MWRLAPDLVQISSRLCLGRVSAVSPHISHPVLEVQRRRFSRVPRRVLLEPRLDPIAKVLVEHLQSEPAPCPAVPRLARRGAAACGVPRVPLVQARAGRGGQPQRARRARRSELLLVRLLGRPLLLVHRLAALVAAPRVHLADGGSRLAGRGSRVAGRGSRVVARGSWLVARGSVCGKRLLSPPYLPISRGSVCGKRLLCEIWGDMGRYGRCAERGCCARYGEIWGDMVGVRKEVVVRPAPLLCGLLLLPALLLAAPLLAALLLAALAS